MSNIYLNADLGEGYGVYRLTDESQIMSYIDQANVACGFHGGDPTTIAQSLMLAKQFNVSVGAHPSFPDRQGFGRRDMDINSDELVDILVFQVSCLIGVAATHDVQVHYVKPHGALYNKMMRCENTFNTILQAMGKLQVLTDKLGQSPLSLMILATPNYKQHAIQASRYSVSLTYEAFADRRYTASGSLTPRSESNAVLSVEEALLQADGFIEQNASFPVDSLCVHGDSEGAIELTRRLREKLNARRVV